MQDIYRRRSKKHGIRRFLRLRDGDTYQRADGSFGRLVHWQGECVKCGAPFEITAPETTHLSRCNQFDRVHCDEHKQRSGAGSRRAA